MKSRRIQWALFLVPALVIGGFETIRHTLLEQVLPMELGNWVTACIDAAVIAVITRRLILQFSKTERELHEERAARTILEERERLARELHDQIAQNIFYSGIQINAVRAKFVQNEHSEVVETLDQVNLSLREIDDNVRQAIFNLKNNPPGHVNLPSRFRSYLRRAFGETSIHWKFDCPDPCPTLDITQQIQLFGILQESITNILKHANATDVTVSLSNVADDPTRWRFAVTDNGQGFDFENRSSRRFGLDIIKSRSYDIGADISIHSDDEGTSVQVISGKST